jgi:hypothetical protein
MRITGPSGPAATTSKGSVRRTSSGTFALPQEEEAPTATSAGSGVATLAGIDALIALQGIETPTERRRRAVGRGKSALDVLDDLKVALLSGTLDAGALDRLRMVALGLTDPSGDPGLDQVLAEIDLRVQVELAKMQADSA